MSLWQLIDLQPLFTPLSLILSFQLQNVAVISLFYGRFSEKHFNDIKSRLELRNAEHK